MPRIYTKKTDRDLPEGNMKQAITDVLEGNMSARGSATKNNVTKSRLCNYIKKIRQRGLESINLSPNYKQSQIFTNEMENALAVYLMKCSSMFYGLTPKAVKHLAYEFAVQNELKVPASWKENKGAGKDWFWGFMKRHPNLSIRKPEATSLARMTSFNESNVKVFQDKLEEILRRYSLAPTQIFNLDETGLTTVQKVQKIVGKKGEHQVGQATSRERGELVTQVGIISASGFALPPVWIFPRKRFDGNRMMSGVSESGALGLVHQSGWMTTENFIKVLEHFVKHTRCTIQNRMLLVMDNHESHLSFQAIQYCRSNGVVILTLPPHTSNKLQPLDKTVFGPFKRFFNQGMDSWMLNHPGQTLGIYDLPSIAMEAWDRSATPSNIKSGFRSTGIFPFDRNIFTEQDFLCSFVTDRPENNANESKSNISQILIQNENNASQGKVQNADGNSSAPKSPEPGTSGTQFVSPEVLRPYPKAPVRKESTKGRKRGRSMIATDTPEKLEIEKRQEKKKPPLKKVKEVKGKVLESSSSDSEENISYKDNSSEDELNMSNYDDDDIKDATEGDYLIVKVHGKGASLRNYVALVDKKQKDGYTVSFLKRHIASNRFTMADEEAAFVPHVDVRVKLPAPLTDTRSRYEGMVYFNMDLTEFSLF